MPQPERREMPNDAEAIRRRLLAEISEQIQSAPSREIRAVHERTYQNVTAASDAAVLEYAAHMVEMKGFGR